MKTNAILNVERYNKCSQFEINKKFIGGCGRGDIALLDFLLNNPELCIRPNLKEVKINAFNATISKASFETFEFLLSIYKDVPYLSYANILIRNDKKYNEYCIPKLKNQSLKDLVFTLVRQDRLEQIEELLKYKEVSFSRSDIEGHWGNLQS